jgi:hypothetical protein
MHLLNRHAGCAQALQKVDPDKIIRRIAPVAAARPANRTEQSYPLIIAQRMDTQSGMLGNFLNCEFFFHISSIQVRARSKSRKNTGNPEINAQISKDSPLLRPRVAVPMHYTFTAGPLGDRLFLRYTGTAAQFAEEMARRVPATAVHILNPGEPLQIPSLS